MWIHFACCGILLVVLIVSGIKNTTQKKEKNEIFKKNIKPGCGAQ